MSIDALTLDYDPPAPKDALVCANFELESVSSVPVNF